MSPEPFLMCCLNTEVMWVFPRVNAKNINSRLCLFSFFFKLLNELRTLCGLLRHVLSISK